MSAASDLLAHVPQSTARAVARVLGASKNTAQQALVTRPLELVDLTGPGLAHVGADAELWAGRDYALCGRWALAFWRHPQQPDGLYYSSRHDPQRGSLVLFDRAQGDLHCQEQGGLTDQVHLPLLVDILDTYRFQLLP
jgi:hypothetical protein